MRDKISSSALIILIVISIILFVLSLMDNVDPILYGSYVFFGIGILVTIFGGVTGLMAKPSSLKGMLIGVGSMVVVFFLGYILADGSDIDAYQVDISEGMSHFSGMLLYSTYILFGAAVATLVLSRVYSLMR